MRVILVGRWSLIMAVLNALNMGMRFIENVMRMGLVFPFRVL